MDPRYKNQEAFIAGYIECALWSSIDDHDQPMDSNYGPEDLADITMEAMREDCVDFLQANTGTLALYADEYSYAFAGHDFWLTRNGHGAGFWDRDLPGTLGDKLSDAARDSGTVDLYVGDDGEVYS